MRSLSSKSGWPSVVKPAVWVLLTGVILHASALLGVTYSVNRLDDPLALVINAATYCNGVLNDCSFRQAVIKANFILGPDTILLPAGSYTLSQVGLPEGLAETGDVDARDDLTIIGDMDGSGNPTSIIQGCGGTSGVVCVGGTAWNDKFISTNKLRDTSGSLSIANVIFQNGNNTNTDLVNSPGGAVDFFGCAPEGGGCSNNGGVTFLPPSSLTISNVRFLNNTVAGCAANECGGGLVSRFGTTAISGVLFFGNTATLGRGGALALVGAKETMMVTSSTFNANHSGLEGGALSVNFQNNSLAVLNVSSSVITGNLAAGSGGGGIYVAAGGTLNLQNSRIANNTVVAGGPNGMAVEAAGTSTVNATNNWWGCNAGPSASPCDTVATVNIGTVTLPNFNPWLVLAITALPNQILVGSTSNLAADLAHNSSGGTGFSVPNGTPIAFGGTLGTDSPINATSANGIATSVFTAGTTAGAGTGTATVDSQTVSATIAIFDVAVPNVVGLTQTAATTSINAAGLVVGVVTSAPSSTVPVGNVISESPSAGILVNSGSAVDLVVSTGVAVPNVVGLTQTAATTSINAAGLVVGVVTSAPSSTVPIGNVISESPSAGILVNSGSAVDLVVSTGVAVPNVVGLTQTAATTSINAAGLVVGTVTTVSSFTVPAGNVISESPTAGMHVNAGSAVDIMVSTGPPPADFSISAAPSSVTVQQGGTGSTTIRTTVVGSPGSVTLTVAVSPSGTGVTVSLTPASLSAGANSNLSIIATSTATAGPYTITITGTEGATTHSTTVSLTVTVRPLLRFTSSSLDFGTVNLNKLVSRNISVTNLGTSAISITTLSITLGTADAAAYTPTSFCLSPLPPSKTCTIKVAFRADAVGTLTSTLNVTDTAPFSPQQISLTGTVINPLAQFSPRPLWFGNVVVGQNKTLPVQLTNIGQTDLIITGIVLGGTNPGDFSQANNCPAVLPPTASCTIQGTFTPTVVGTRTAILIVTDNVAGGKSTTTFTGVGK